MDRHFFGGGALSGVRRRSRRNLQNISGGFSEDQIKMEEFYHD